MVKIKRTQIKEDISGNYIIKIDLPKGWEYSYPYFSLAGSGILVRKKKLKKVI